MFHLKLKIRKLIINIKHYYLKNRYKNILIASNTCPIKKEHRKFVYNQFLLLILMLDGRPFCLSQELANIVFRNFKDEEDDYFRQLVQIKNYPEVIGQRPTDYMLNSLFFSFTNDRRRKLFYNAAKLLS